MLQMNRQSIQDRMSLKRKTGNGNGERQQGTSTGEQGEQGEQGEGQN